MNIHEKIKCIRAEQGLTQKAFAEKLHISHHTVSKWETEINNPTISDIRQICEVYNIPLSEIMGIPMCIKDNPYYETTLTAIYKFQLICQTEELINEICKQTNQVERRTQLETEIKKVIEELETDHYIVRTKTSNYDVIQMTKHGLDSLKTIITLDETKENISFDTYMYENMPADALYESLKYNIQHLIKNPIMYKSESDEIAKYPSTRERILEMIFGLYDNVRNNTFSDVRVCMWNERKKKLLIANQEIKKDLIFHMLFGYTVRSSSNLQQNRNKNRKGEKTMNVKYIADPLKSIPEDKVFDIEKSALEDTSYVISDYNGEIIKECKKDLEEMGYEIRVVNLIDVQNSNQYNPFHYIRNEMDAMELAEEIVDMNLRSENEDVKKCSRVLLASIVCYLWMYTDEQKQTLSNVLDMLLMTRIEESEDGAKPKLDLPFDAVEIDDPESLAVKQYQIFRCFEANTKKKATAACSDMLSKFSIPQIQTLTGMDELDLENFAKRKSILFVVAPERDNLCKLLMSLLKFQIGRINCANK